MRDLLLVDPAFRRRFEELNLDSAAAVLRFLAEGATVVMVGRDRKKLEAARAELREATQVSAACIVVLPMDAAEPAQVRVAIAKIIAKVGRIDVLVNNAGTAGPKCRLQDLPLLPEDLDALRMAQVL